MSFEAISKTDSVEAEVTSGGRKSYWLQTFGLAPEHPGVVLSTKPGIVGKGPEYLYYFGWG